MREEIARTYLKSRGFVLREGSIESDQLFLPYMILDAVYQIYNNSIKNVPVKFELNRAKKNIIRAYNHFNQQFFRGFDAQMTDEVCDAMDGFDEYIHNELVLTKCAIMDKVKFLDFDTQMLMSDVLLVNLLAGTAGIIYHDTYKGLPERYRDNEDIRAIADNACIFGNLYYKSIGGERKITVNDAAEIDAAIQRLVNRMVKWICRDKTSQS